jgi:hypothetical protein
MTNSIVEICNISIAQLGHEPRINALNENTKAARLCSTLYEPAKKALLRSYLWRFARKRMILSPTVALPEFGSGYKFELPADFIRTADVDDYFRLGYGRWVREGNQIIADTEIFNLIYIYDITNVALFDPMFVSLLASKLAVDLAIPLTQSNTRRSEMIDKYKSDLKAAFVSAVESDSQKFLSEALLQSRA